MPNFDPFNGYPSDRNGPFDNAAAVIPSDNDDLPVVASCIVVADDEEYVDSPDGSYKVPKKLKMKVTTSSGDVVAFNVAGGMVFNLLRIRRIWATGTTATKLVALW